MSSARVWAAFAGSDQGSEACVGPEAFRTVLRSLGNFRDAEISAVFQSMDKDGDGNVQYEDFKNWMISDASRHHARVKAALAAGNVDSLAPVFYAFCTPGQQDMDGKSFLKLCRDTGLVDRKFSATDADLIFAKVVPKGQRRMSLALLKSALALVAAKRGEEEEDVHDLVAHSGGPQLQGTRAEAVRFHDDKSTYTGTRAQAARQVLPTPTPLRSSTGGFGQLAAPAAAAAAAAAAASAAAPRAETRRLSRGTGSMGAKSYQCVFQEFCGAGKSDLDGKGFAKLCRDSQLFDSNFTAQEADLVFANVVRKGQRRIGLEEFEEALWRIGERRGQDYGVVLDCVAACGGPVLQATAAEAVRFYDERAK